MKKGIISRNIGLLMEHFGIRSVAQLAKLIGMPQTTLNKLSSGISPDPKISTLTPLANYFNITIDTLLSEHPVFTHPEAQRQDNWFVPLISYDELPNIHGHLDSLTVNTWPQWHPIPAQEEQGAVYYAVHVIVKQIPPPFHEASVLIVKNDPKLINNSYVLIKHLTSQVVTIKKVVFDNGKQWLLPLQNELPISEFNAQEFQSLGTIQAFVTDISNGAFIIIKGERNG